MTLAPGTRLGPYEIVGLLGTGGMGEVYRAKDLRLGREVAVKLLTAELSASQTAKERFLRDGQAASAINHPNICTLYDIGEHNGRTYLVLELLDGETLRDAIRRGPLPFDEVLSRGQSVADALEAAHTRGIVHRDIKPGKNQDVGPRLAPP
jgi:serine/threonine protein kinase